MKIHGYKNDAIASFQAETICGVYINKEFTTCKKSEINCKRCIAKLKLQ